MMNKSVNIVEFRISTLSERQKSEILQIRYENAAKLRFEDTEAVPGGIRDACRDIKRAGILDDISHTDRRDIVERLTDENILREINRNPLFAIEIVSGQEFTDGLKEDLKNQIIELTSHHGEDDSRESALMMFLQRHLYQRAPDNFFQTIRLQQDMGTIISDVIETFNDDEKASYDEALRSYEQRTPGPSIT